MAPGYPLPPVTATSSPPSGATFFDQWVRNAVTRDQNFNWLTLNPVSPGVWQSRIVALSGLQEATKTDLSAFQAKGGKLLIIHGTHDVLVSARSTQQYMKRLRAAMGLEKVSSFARYYEVPGFNHVVGRAFHPAWNSLSALEDWVEKGAAPSNPVATDTIGVPGRTRPLCEFPAWPKYKGSGDVNSAASFTCATE
ncbi:tannase/feruloyl esterase family alpha/beta hydrolase [Noviherbaspirillum sp. Root189]|uniref:tannase/feruloyl esterase family alpha/beta hydrolase n=1 Tax=Noviherbaspirillum sp. Root189 TaxID=1736487 RepID=UPI001F2C0BCD|nr:tannase/feruloyl esterase family alpha/beta hydrolase [Noviherbaspirillum sp. Root189]